MQLRNHPLLSYKNKPSWPPRWVWIDGGEKKAPEGEIGILRNVICVSLAPPYSCFLEIEQEGSIYLGRLWINDFSFFRRITELFQGQYGRSIKEIGNIEMAQYRVLVFCALCGRTHPMRTTVLLKNGPIQKATVAAAYKGRPLPFTVVNLLKKDILCPESASPVMLDDPERVYLVPAN